MLTRFFSFALFLLKGLTFELSLPNVFRYEAEYGIWYDFHRVRGLGVCEKEGEEKGEREGVEGEEGGGDEEVIT